MVRQMLTMAASRKPVVMAPLTVLRGCIERTPLLFASEVYRERYFLGINRLDPKSSLLNGNVGEEHVGITLGHTHESAASSMAAGGGRHGDPGGDGGVCPVARANFECGPDRGQGFRVRTDTVDRQGGLDGDLGQQGR